MSEVLTVEDISVIYRVGKDRSSRAVSQASFSLQAGKVLGLAGESGCGKSTLALAAIGFTPPGGEVSTGSSRLGDTDLLKLSRGDLRKIWGKKVAYVAQSAATALNPAITIERQLSQVMKLHLGIKGKEARKRQLEMLESVGLPDPERALLRFPHGFSGGQQQRIAIAMAMICGPEVLLLDEPTTGLDITTQERISKLILKLVADTGTAALYVSHDLGLLSTVADDLAVMYAGEMVEVGSATAVTTSPKHPYSRALLSALPSTVERRKLEGIPGQPPLSAIDDACAFADRCPFVTDACRNGHIPMTETADGRQVRCIRLAELPEFEWARAVEEREEIRETDPPKLEVRNIECRYPKAARPAVSDVSLQLSRGEVLGIVGESGSGKSTLLKAISGLHLPSGGEVLIDGEPVEPKVSKRPRSSRGELQLVFQNPDTSLNPRHTVGSLIQRSLHLFRPEISRGDEAAAIAEVLNSVQLPAATANRLPMELSGGQRQRVALARAFAAKPSVLLCDEVTSALDVSVQATVVELIAEICDQTGTAVIFVTHDLGVVRTIADRVMVMQNGEVREEADSEILFSTPRDPYTRELLEAVPQLGGS